MSHPPSWLKSLIELFNFALLCFQLKIWILPRFPIKQWQIKSRNDLVLVYVLSSYCALHCRTLDDEAKVHVRRKKRTKNFSGVVPHSQLAIPKVTYTSGLLLRRLQNKTKEKQILPSKYRIVLCGMTNFFLLDDLEAKKKIPDSTPSL